MIIINNNGNNNINRNNYMYSLPCSSCKAFRRQVESVIRRALKEMQLNNYKHR